MASPVHRYHPDKVQGNEAEIEKATEIFREIQDAYEVLMDVKKRRMCAFAFAFAAFAFAFAAATAAAAAAAAASCFHAWPAAALSSLPALRTRV